MGRKGTSKRKPSKSKNLPVTNKGPNSVGSTFANVSKIDAPEVVNKGEAISIGSSGKMKPSNSQRNSNKR